MNTPTTSEFVLLELIVTNPCETGEIALQANMVNLRYVLYTFSESEPYKYTFPGFPAVVRATDYTTELCGEKIYGSIFLDGKLVDETSSPVAYKSASSEFEIYSEDILLIGTPDLVIIG